MKVKGLKHGFYEIYWSSGGSSLASVGFDAKGYNWFAPCNWISGSTVDWSGVSYIKLITANPYDRRTKGIKGEGNKVKFNSDNFNIEDDETENDNLPPL